jgi:general secretion pathway protein A
MYEKFFSFKERPFKLVPNPAYLFLSKSHQEAMAHLVYAAGAGDGFLDITGEVGTGKTTLCRAFLDRLDSRTEAAYIFNPVPNSLGLLKAINDEFGISSEPDSQKALLDILNRFLIAAKSDGRDVVLVIDEAQNLSTEVLEQIRLISNLETSLDKLLQIVLVGQPELREMLDSRELRQLRQRITLSCRLVPLDRDETEAYIRHRIRIASGRTDDLFTQKAIRTIHRYSGGIPRLINIACDRSLLMAYSFDKAVVDGKVAEDASLELGNRPLPVRSARFGGLGWVTAVLAVLTIGMAAVLAVPRIRHLVRQETISTGDREQAEAGPLPRTYPIDRAVLATELEKKRRLPETSPEQAPPATSLGRFLQTRSESATRESAFRSVLALWEPDAALIAPAEPIVDDRLYFTMLFRRHGFSFYRIDDDLDLVLRLNLPAILEFRAPESGRQAFLGLVRIDGQGRPVFSTGGGEEILVPGDRGAALPFWSGAAYIPWRNFFSITGEFPGHPPSESLISLKLLLKDIGFSRIDLSPRYDEATRNAVARIQRKHHLPVDGVVGSLTKITLYNEIDSLNIPHLTPRSPESTDGTIGRSPRAKRAVP